MYIMKYKCLKELYLDDYDENGFPTGKYITIPVGSIWEVDRNIYGIISENDTIRLSLITKEYQYQWIEILGLTLNKHFKSITDNEAKINDLLLPLKNDKYDIYRKEYNSIIKKTLT